MKPAVYFLTNIKVSVGGPWSPALRKYKKVLESNSYYCKYIILRINILCTQLILYNIHLKLPPAPHKRRCKIITPPFCLPPNPTAIWVKLYIFVIFPDFADLVLKSLFCLDFMCFTVMNHAYETNINVLVTNSGAKTDNSFYLCGRCMAHNAWLLNNMFL